MPRNLLQTLAVVVCALLSCVVAAPTRDSGLKNKPDGVCRRTKVLVLGAGLAGITAAQAMHNVSMNDFVIVEYNGEIGGRVKHTDFGADANGQPYTIELGANWVQGLVSPGGPENPIWTLAKKWQLENTYSDYSSILTYNASGAANYTDLLDEFAEVYAKIEQDAGYLWAENLQDRSFRAALSINGWNSKGDMNRQAVEFWDYDFEYAQTPEQSSEEFSVINYNTTFYQYSAENNFVFDKRGFNAFIKGEASTFLKENDPRLLLNTIVAGVNYSSSSVTATMTDGSCITADYAICTFSLGVLQQRAVAFVPELPEWKQNGIYAMQMGTYTKIFLQFPPEKQFWDADTQFFLYADPITRGAYPVFQSLSTPGFHPGSGILFVTVVSSQAYEAEIQSDEQTKQEVLAVLRTMFPDKEIPEPTAFYYPRWSQVPWSYGSYSNYPPGTTLETHQNLRANVGRLWFAGEATSAEYFGFLQGAYFEGQAAGTTIGGCLTGNKKLCRDQRHYDNLRSTTSRSDMTPKNGWTVSSFQTFGFAPI